MNSRPSQIRFTGSNSVDDVIVAITLIDSFTGEAVRVDPKEIRIFDGSRVLLRKRAIQNLSGKLVFIRTNRLVNGTLDEFEKEKSEYRIEINTESAGYFNPEEVTFKPPGKSETDFSKIIKARHIVIPLHRLPTVKQAADATLVSGVVTKNNKPISEVTISAELPSEVVPPSSGDITPFITKSNKRGAFILPLRLPEQAYATNAEIKFLFSDTQANQREFLIPINMGIHPDKIRIIKDGKLQSFPKPIEILESGVPSVWEEES